VLNTYLFAFASGLTCASFLDRLDWTPLVAGGCGLLCLIPGRLRRWRAAFCLCCAACAGLALYLPQLQPPQSSQHISNFCGQNLLNIEGSVLQVERRLYDRASIDVECCAITNDDLTTPVHGRVRVYMDSRPEFFPGTRIRFQSTLRLTKNFGTPGEFDHVRHLAHQNIHVTAFLPDQRPPEVLDEANLFDLPTSLAIWREWLNRQIDRTVPCNDAPWIRALVTGSKRDLPTHIRRMVANAGVAHLFAISGLHFGILAYALYRLLKIIYCRSERLLLWAPPGRILPLTILPFLVLYLFLSGSGLATTRAFAVAALTATVLWQERRVKPQDILSSALFLILLFDPLALFEPSLQLSVAGAYGILLIRRPWLEPLRALPKPFRWLLQLFAVSLAATLATTPLALIHFHQLAPAAPLNNLWVIPLISLGSVPLALLGAVIAPLSQFGAAKCWQFSSAILHQVFFGLEKISLLPGLAGGQIYLTPMQCSGVVLTCWSILLLANTRNWKFAVLPPLGIFLYILPPQVAHHLQVTMLSVGQGESLILRLPDDRTFLIDGGGLYSRTFDTGERLVAPALSRLGITHLDAVVLSHPHPDHARGLPHILWNFPVDEFWFCCDEEELPDGILPPIAQRNIQKIHFRPGWHMLTDEPELKLAAFVPVPDNLTKNDESLVIYAGNRTHGLLLTGDIEKKGIQQLLANKPPGIVDLLKIPHHGSRHSSPETLIPALKPKLAIASVGAGNRYGFPHRQTMSVLEDNAIPLLRTDLEGSLRLTAEASGWHVEGWKTGFFIDKIPSH